MQSPNASPTKSANGSNSNNNNEGNKIPLPFTYSYKSIKEQIPQKNWSPIHNSITH